ncbi:MAG: MarR family transcriptional regulator [Clostridia bacterium]|nr:MarR family transcriptional regulator [Clostridia bacterium]
MRQELGFRLRCLSHYHKRLADRSPAKAQMEHVTGTHGWVIGYLYDHRQEDIFQRDLERVFQMRRSTATGILQLMEKNELITRESVRHDARLKKLCLTEKALRLHESFGRDLNRIEQEMVKGLSAEELLAFSRTMEKMMQNLNDYEKELNETEECKACT